MTNSAMVQSSRNLAKNHTTERNLNDDNRKALHGNPITKKPAKAYLFLHKYFLALDRFDNLAFSLVYNAPTKIGTENNFFCHLKTDVKSIFYSTITQ